MLLITLLSVVITQAVAISPASAHGFALDILTTPAPGALPESGARDGSDGFLLAVDESPDVSHPAGAEGGDHLGGIDVDIEVRSATATPRSDAQVVVVWESSGAADLERWRTDNPDGLAIIVRDPATAPISDTLGGPSVTLQMIDRLPSTSVVAAFSDAFEIAEGRVPSRIDGSGYDAGLLVDALIAELGSNFARQGSVEGISRDIESELVATRVAAVATGTGPSVGRPAASAASVDTDPSGPPIAMLAFGGLILAGALALALRRRRRLDGDAEPTIL